MTREDNICWARRKREGRDSRWGRRGGFSRKEMREIRGEGRDRGRGRGSGSVCDRVEFNWERLLGRIDKRNDEEREKGEKEKGVF